MPTGRAASPIPRTSPATLVELIPNDTATTTKVTAAPLASHFSCWRCSPEARRQLSTWWATNDSQIARIEHQPQHAPPAPSGPPCDFPELTTSPKASRRTS